ncbi:Licodione synthase [Acorus calamus]|uniref:Licodione synthase n=1 Tax=Acorus calamus TaxID=4465 RepID=A0AAV9FFU9_ACOCL|nr:Licodione synthase [Acorus calamus]
MADSVCSWNTRDFLGSSTLTVDAFCPIQREERLRLVALLRDKTAAREIINVSEKLHKASNNGIIRMVTGMREGGGVDEAKELVKGVVETIQTFNLSDFVWVLRGVDVQGIKGRIDDVYRGFDEILERIIGREEEENIKGFIIVSIVA